MAAAQARQCVSPGCRQPGFPAVGGMRGSSPRAWPAPYIDDPNICEKMSDRHGSGCLRWVFEPRLSDPVFAFELNRQDLTCVDVAQLRRDECELSIERDPSFARRAGQHQGG